MQDNTNLSPDELYQRALDVIRERELSAYFDQLAPRLDFLIDIQTEDANEGDIALGAHKIGGSPDVAPDFKWLSSRLIREVYCHLRGCYLSFRYFARWVLSRKTA